jgi:uncharacterized protein
MNRTFKAAVAALVFAVGFACSAAAGPLEDVAAAYRKGDYATAVRLMRPLAEQGNAAAQYNLAHMYRNGHGVPQDYAAAVKWYRKAAEQGNDVAQANLAVMYDKGLGIPQDYTDAVRWYRTAAEHGNAEAQLNLAVMYALGKGIPQDFVTAHMWLNVAAGSGNKAAEEGRDMIAAQMTYEQIAEAQKLAREWKPK